MITNFFDRIKKIDTGCWEWQGYTSVKGYGGVKIKGRTRLAHRESYKMFVGLLTPGLTIDHLCRNRKCVNPMHLEEVSNRVNILRGINFAAKNARKLICCHGHNNWRTSGPNRRYCRTCQTLRQRKYRSENRGY